MKKIILIMVVILIPTMAFAFKTVPTKYQGVFEIWQDVPNADGTITWTRESGTWIHTYNADGQDIIVPCEVQDFSEGAYRIIYAAPLESHSVKVP